MPEKGFIPWRGQGLYLPPPSLGGLPGDNGHSPEMGRVSVWWEDKGGSEPPLYFTSLYEQLEADLALVGVRAALGLQSCCNSHSADSI